MENQQETRINLEKFTWIVESFSKNTKKLESESFEIGGCRWKITMNPIGEGVDQLSLCLKVSGKLPTYRWRRFVYFKLALINQMDTERSIVRETEKKFNSGYRIWCLSFINIVDFCNPEEGYLINDNCIIEAHIRVSDVESNTNITNENLINIVPTNGFRTGNQEIESSNEICETSQRAKKVEGSDLTLRDIIDFDKLGEEEKTYVPLLEEVCKYHLSLIRSQKKKPDLCKVKAFISLGKVLLFLNTTKAKDMNEDACNELYFLWNELNESSGFNLAWLEPHIHNALGVKAQLKRTLVVKTLQDSVVAMDIEMKRLRGEYGAINAEFKVANKALIEARKGFTEMDFNVALDYAMFR